MDNPQTSTSAPRRPLYLLGVLLVLLGPVLYFIQLQLHYLKTPWYLPVLASAGVLLMALSLRQRRGIFRIVFLLLFALVCGFEWFMILVAFKTPAYTGP